MENDELLFPNVSLTVDSNKLFVNKTKPIKKTVFYIDDIEYEFDEDMTFEQWLTSDYNTFEYYEIENGHIDFYEYYSRRLRGILWWRVLLCNGIRITC